MPRINIKAAIKKKFKAKNPGVNVDLNDLYDEKKENVKERKKL